MQGLKNVNIWIPLAILNGTIALQMAISRSAWSILKQTKANILVIIHLKDQSLILVLARVLRKTYRVRVAKKVFSFRIILSNINIELLGRR
jgi:hypothetical protein